MMSLFDEEEVMRSYIRSERYEAAQEAAQKAAQDTAKKAAVRMIKAGKMSLEDIADYTDLPLDDVKNLKKEATQPA